MVLNRSSKTDFKPRYLKLSAPDYGPMTKTNPLFPVFIFSVFILSASAAYSWGLYPVRIAKDLPPGGSFTQVVTIDNAGSSETSRIDMNTIDWVMNEQGEVGFPPAGEATNSVSKCITYSPAQLVLGPGERRAMRVTVSLPPDIGPGEHIGGLSATERTIPHQAVPLTARISVAMGVKKIYVMPIIITVTGGKEESTSIVNLDVQQSSADKPYEAIVRLKNPSNVRINPLVSFSLKNSANVEVFSSKATNYLLLRESERIVRFELPQEFVGKYTLFAKVDQGGKFAILEATKQVELQALSKKVEPAAPAAPAAPSAPAVPEVKSNELLMPLPGNSHKQ